MNNNITDHTFNESKIDFKKRSQLISYLNIYLQERSQDETYH